MLLRLYLSNIQKFVAAMVCDLPTCDFDHYAFAGMFNSADKAEADAAIIATTTEVRRLFHNHHVIVSYEPAHVENEHHFVIRIIKKSAVHQHPAS